jgi:hypothetical protein
MANLTHQWINKLEQFGRVEIDLVITDLDQEVPDYRMTKSYESELVNDDFLSSEAESVKAKILEDFNAKNIYEASKATWLSGLSDEDKQTILVGWLNNLPDDQKLNILTDYFDNSVN